MPSQRSRRFVEAALFLLCAAVLTIQLLMPPYIGLANNGDFGKVCSRFSLAPRGGWGDNFIFFTPDYEFAPANYWRSDVLSSEIALAAVPIAATHFAGSSHFNIRRLGAFHCLLFLAAFLVLLRYLRQFRPVIQFVVGLAVLWIIGDVAYTAYFNSFFSDAAAVLGLLLAVVFALRLAARDRPDIATLALFTAAALLFVTSKTQHGVFAILPAVFVFATGWRSRQTRIAGAAASVILLFGMAADFLSTSDLYSSQPLFNLIFFKLTPESVTPRQDLLELGLPDSDLKYAGTHAYMPGSPVTSPVWAADFVRRSGYGAVFRFYLRHPTRAIRILEEDLHREAYLMRCPNLSNFRRADGHPAGALTSRFASWSSLRSRLLLGWPEHLIVWYGLAIAAALAAAWRARRSITATRRTAVLFLGITLLGVLEFCFASLTDACETYRHLLLFHLITDITICFGLTWGMVGLSHVLRKGARN